MTYDQVDGSEDRFRHRENGTGGGRLSITTAGHGTTAESSRRIRYYVQGSITDLGLQSPTISTSASLVTLGESVDVNVTFDTAAETASLSTSGGSVDLLAIDASDDVPGDGMVIVSDSPTSDFTYEVLLTAVDQDDEMASAEVLVVDPAAEAPDNVFSSAIKNDSPLFYYRFEEDADAPFLLDSSGNGHHTSDFPSSLVLGESPGGMQKAARFANSSILVPATSNMSTSFTATAVVNSDAFESGALQGIFSMADANFVGRSILYTQNLERFGTFIDGVASLSGAEATPSDSTSCLIHYVFDADPDNDPATTNATASFYLNGELVGGAALPLANPVEENVGQWVLGSHKNRTTQFFQGSIDEAAVFEEALTDTEIAAHATAFFAAADPLLGFVSDVTAIDLDDEFTSPTVTFSWKVSDTATAVTINGIPQSINGGGVYTSSFDPVADTTYLIEVSGPGGPFTESIDVTVVGTPPVPPAAPQITAISLDAASPPNVTLELSGTAGTAYFIKSSANLNDGFSVEVADDVVIDANGVATVTFLSVDGFRFFRAEEAP